MLEFCWPSTLVPLCSLSISLTKVPCSFITLCSSPKALLGWFGVLFSVKFSSTARWVWEVLGEGRSLPSQRIEKRDNDLQREWLKSNQSHVCIVKTSVAIFCTCLYWKKKNNKNYIFFIWREHQKKKKFSFYLIYKVSLWEREERWSCHNYNGIEPCSVCKHFHGVCNVFPRITDSRTSAWDLGHRKD